MKATTTRERVDGRRAWRERNRTAVVDALLDFYTEGVINPGAQEIAERSGVSRRSLFRYFDDMDDLCRVAIERHAERVKHLFEMESLGEGKLEERIDRIVDQRVRLFEAIAPVRRIAKLRAPFQPIIAGELRRVQSLHRREIERQFEPEMSNLGSAQRRGVLAAADVLLSFESFDLMRDAQGLSAKQTEEALRDGLTAIFSSQRS